jgi:putative hydrolase of the HAD superfamily
VPLRGLIFDYGGVLLDMRWDTMRALEAEYELAERVIAQTLYGSETWRRLAVGVGDRDAWLEEAHSELERVAGRPMPRLHDRWRETQRLIAPNIELIRRLRPPYRTAVLSNADNTLSSRLRDRYQIADLFDDVVCSADIALAKPDTRIYALAAQRLDLQPAECVFVDDMEGNVEAARSAGMQAIHFRIDRGDSLAEQFAALGVEAANQAP